MHLYYMHVSCAKMVQHVYAQMLEYTVFKHNLPMQK